MALRMGVKEAMVAEVAVSVVDWDGMGKRGKEKGERRKEEGAASISSF